MIKELFVTKIFETEDVLTPDDTEKIYNYMVLNAKKMEFITPEDLPELETLKQKILECVTTLTEEYNFKKILVSDKFNTHYYPANIPNEMELHSDDLGDYGKKFVALYYLECEDQAGGELELFDPRWLNPCWREMGTSIKLFPSKNKLIIIPTYLWHKVLTYNSKYFPRMLIDVWIRVE